jgi:hypothetical protein
MVFTPRDDAPLASTNGGFFKRFLKLEKGKTPDFT